MFERLGIFFIEMGVSELGNGFQTWSQFVRFSSLAVILFWPLHLVDGGKVHYQFLNGWVYGLKCGNYFEMMIVKCCSMGRIKLIHCYKNA